MKKKTFVTHSNKNSFFSLMNKLFYLLIFSIIILFFLFIAINNHYYRENTSNIIKEYDDKFLDKYYNDIDNRYVVNYNVSPQYRGDLCTSRFKHSYYYPVPDVCQLKCDLEIKVPYPVNFFDECEPVKRLIDIRNNKIIPREDVSIEFTNTYFTRDGGQQKYKVKAKINQSIPIQAEYIFVKGRENVNNTYLHFIPTQLNGAKQTPGKYSVNIYFLDGCSRSQIHYQLRETVEYLNSRMNKYDVFEFFRYHTIGHNSIPNYLPMFYGINETIAKSDKKGKYYEEFISKIYDDEHYKSIVLQQFCDPHLNFHHNAVTHHGCHHEFGLGCLEQMY